MLVEPLAYENGILQQAPTYLLSSILHVKQKVEDVGGAQNECMVNECLPQ
jgi:hypothetical protein